MRSMRFSARLDRPRTMRMKASSTMAKAAAPAQSNWLRTSVGHESAKVVTKLPPMITGVR